MALWTWPAGCGVLQSGAQGHLKRTFQLRRIQAQGELKSGAVEAPERWKYQSLSR